MSEQPEQPEGRFDITDAHGTLLEVERVERNGRVLINILEMEDSENSRGTNRMFITDDMEKIAAIRDALTAVLTHTTALSPASDAQLVELSRMYEATTQGEWYSDQLSNAVTCSGAWVAQFWSKQEFDFDNDFNNREFTAAIHNAFPSLLARQKLLTEVACSGVEHDDARLDYVTVQIPRDVWALVTAKDQAT